MMESTGSASGPPPGAGPEVHSKHVIRAFLLLALALIGSLGARALLIPSSFGAHGHFRADNVKEQMDHPVAHGGRESCAKCHAEQHKLVMEHEHKVVNCENCHAPLAVHARGDKKIAAMPKDRKATLCVRCHERLAARPKTHPQVDVLEHLKEVGETFHPEVCVDCHNPHSPV